MVAFVPGWKVPPAHGVHTEVPSADAILPAEQGVGATDPVPQELPAGHGLHSAAELRSVALENEPDGHGSTAEAPMGQ